MKNQSYLDALQELEDDKRPYTSISDREPLEDISPQGVAAKLNFPVFDVSSDKADGNFLPISNNKSGQGEIYGPPAPSMMGVDQMSGVDQGTGALSKKVMEAISKKVAAQKAHRGLPAGSPSPSPNPIPAPSSIPYGPPEEAYGPPEGDGILDDVQNKLDGLTPRQDPLPTLDDVQGQLDNLKTAPSPSVSAPTDSSDSSDSMQSDEPTEESDRSPAWEDDLDQYRRDLQNRNNITNFSHAMAQAAQGVETPKINDALYNNITQQNNALLNSNSHSMDLRQKIAQSIEDRKSREGIAANALDKKRQSDADNNDIRRLMIQSNQQKATDKASKADENRKSMQDLRTAGIMNGVIGQINKDPIIKPSEQNLASLYKSHALLNNPNLPITSQVLSDSEQDIASALALRGQGATEGKIKRTELINLARSFAELRQKFGTGVVDLRKSAPQVVDQIKKVNQALIDDYDTTINTRKNSIYNQYSDAFGDNADLQGRINKLRTRTNGLPAASPAPSPSPAPNSNGPQPGDVEDGHKFKGGDPSDPANWEEV